MRRREFRGVAWLAADMNVAPDTTLDTVEAIVTHPTVNIRGLLLTLKLLDWEMADEIPELSRTHSRLGIRHGAARQLDLQSPGNLCRCPARQIARSGKKPAARRKTARQKGGD